MLVGVLGGDDQDAAHRAGRRAQLAADASLETVVVSAEIVAAAVALRSRRLVLGVLERDLRREELAEGRLQAAGQRTDVGGYARPLAFGSRGHAFVRPAQRRGVVRPD